MYEEGEEGFSEVVVETPSVRWSWLEVPIALFQSIAHFATSIAHALMRHYNWQSSRREFQDDIRADIERIPTVER